jgi:hypothetical protein
MRERYRRYAILFGLPLVLAGAFLGASYGILHGLGETTGPIEAAQLQERNETRYSSALAYRPRPYKIERTLLRQRETIILGSSRVMQFVPAPWGDKATNAGGAMRDMASGHIFADQILAAYHPKRIIIGIDWWWFAANREVDSPRDLDPILSLSLPDYLRPAEWLLDGSLRPARAWQSLVAPADLPPGIGFSARLQYAGWDAFGHYDYGRALMVQTDNTDVQFRETLDEVQSTSVKNFRYPGVAFSESYWQQFVALLEKLEAAGVEVVLFMPPIAAPLYDWVAAQPEPNTVNEVRRRLASLETPFFDFHDPRSLGTSDCEFVDGQHGGEVTYLRILSAMATAKAADLDQIVDLPLIERLIVENEGRAGLRSADPDRPAEIDFLGLGCAK